MNSLCVNVVLPHWFNSDFIGCHIIFGCLICNNNYYNSASKDKSTHWLPQQARLLSQQSGLMLLESCNGGGGGITVCPSVLLAFSTFWNVPTLLSPVCLKCCSLKRALPSSLSPSEVSDDTDASAFHDTNASCLHIYPPHQKKYPFRLFCLFPFSANNNKRPSFFPRRDLKIRETRTRRTDQDDMKGL